MGLAAGNLEIATPRWAVPLLEPAPFKGAFGGRSSGKSHTFAENLIEDHINDRHLASVCIREVQRSLKFSAKRLLEAKIRSMGVGHLFEVQGNEIKDKRGDGIIIFQGMQDHTAESIKSLEGFRRAWVEEAQSLSKRSLELLTPTIRADGSEIWFTWNPDQPTDPVDDFMREHTPQGAIVVETNYLDNPFLPRRSFEEAQQWMKRDPDGYAHVWLGEYRKYSDAQVLQGKWRIDEFQPGKYWDGPYQGLDFGFSTDPTAAVRCWIHDGRLFIEHEAGDVGLELDDTAGHIGTRIPEWKEHVTRGDNARPESISYLKRHGMPRLQAVTKWSGSREDGVEFLRQFDEIVIHPRCKETQTEARLWSFKTDAKTGDVKPELKDGNDHYWDAVRYALQPLIKPKRAKAGVW